jgi:hypothetical protein
MIVQDRPILIRQPQTIEIGSMIRPKSVHETGGIQRRKPGVLMEVQRTALDTRIPALVALIHCNIRAANLK